MKLQRSTVILVGLALVLGAGVLIAEGQKRSSDPASPTQAAGQQPLYDFSEAAVAKLTVQRQGETLEFQKDGEGAWQMVQPEAATAEPGAIAFLLSRILTDRPTQEITISPEQQGDFGFDRPTGQVELTLEDGSVHRVVLGKDDFSGSSLYVLKDPEAVPLPQSAPSTTVYVMSKDLANGVSRPLAEWQMATDSEASPAPAGDQTPSPGADGVAPAAPAAPDSSAPAVSPSPAPAGAAAPAPTPSPEAAGGEGGDSP